MNLLQLRAYVGLNDINRFIGTTFLHPGIVIRLQLSPATSPQPPHPPHIPKMDNSSNRLFRFSKPEWLNNSAVRNGGVYVAGALVSIRSTLLHLHSPGSLAAKPQA
jgi:hypothetical protein